MTTDKSKKDKKSKLKKLEVEELDDVSGGVASVPGGSNALPSAGLPSVGVSRDVLCW